MSPKPNSFGNFLEIVGSKSSTQALIIMVKALADYDWDYDSFENPYCRFCDNEDDRIFAWDMYNEENARYDFPHKDDCPVMLARTFLKEYRYV